MFKATNDYNPEILYKNLRRPEVDALFSRRDEIIEDVQFCKEELHNSDSESKKTALQNRINKLMPKISELDTKARELWREIKLKAKKQ